MKKYCFAVFIVLLSSVCFGESIYKEELDRNIAEAHACVTGFAVAIKFFGQPQHKEKNNSEVLNMVKAACVTDKYVAITFSLQRNSKNAKSLNEIKLFVEDWVSDWYIKQMETLDEAEKKFKN